MLRSLAEDSQSAGFMRIAVGAALLFAMSLATFQAQSAPENARFFEGKKHILFIGHSKYYDHDGVSPAALALAKVGEQSGAFDVTFRTDYQLITKAKIPNFLNQRNLNYYDAVMLYTQGELLLDDQQKKDLISFVRDDGKALLVAHSGVDHNSWQFHPDGKMSVKDKGGWPELTEMMGGVFINHPWRQPVRINVEDREFPATRHLPQSFAINDEIYQVIDFSREKVRVLMTLDTSTVDMVNPPLAPVVRTDGDFALAWVREYGKGRVFVSPLGHIVGTWSRPDIQQMWLEGAKWAMGLTDGDATPRPRPAAK